MQKHYFCFILAAALLFSNLQRLCAGNEKNSPGAKATAMGGASLTNADANAVFANQAALPNLTGFAFAFSAENRFMLKDLVVGNLALALPTKTGTFGLGIGYFGVGSTAYSERDFKLAYARKLFQQLNIGLELAARQISIDEFGSKTAMTFGLGLQYQIGEKVQVGAHVFNPLRVKLTDNNADKLPMVLKLGMSITPTEEVSFALETEKSLDKKLILKAGIEYRILKALYLRGGFSTEPTLTGFGVGLNLKHFKIDLAGNFHPVLGYSPHFTLIYQR